MSDNELKEMLISSNLVTPEEMDKASDEAAKLNVTLEKAVIDLHILEKDALYSVVAAKMGVSYRSIAGIEVSEDMAKVYSEELSNSTKSVPVEIKDGVLHVAMEDPTDISLIDQIQLFTNYPIEVVYSPADEIAEIKNKMFTRDGAASLFAELQGGTSESGKGEATSIVKIVDLIITQAVRDRASDIHIEPEENITRIRFRIDGILHEIPSPPKDWEPAITSRVKVLSGMDIAESRTPQDGHFQQKADDKVIDFRVSTLPTIHGENLVLRLLDTASVTIGLERMGFSSYEDLKHYEELIVRPYGIILSTGPTGSGKTTTLYSALTRINTVDTNIITLEDPVEYRLGMIRQVQVNPKAGITFANGLRAILRQDPDVIMVGEIRDLETARMAIQAALTGHLVFSTLHTNDSTSSVARLVDMGVESFLVAASLIGVMAQRLVRTICTKCKEPYQPSKVILKKWGLEDKADLVVYRGKGCPVCKGTGFRGRTGLFELLVVTDEIREMINQSASTVALRKKAQESGMRMLWEDGRSKVVKGVTTFEEVARVCEEQADMAKKAAAAAQIEVKRHVELSAAAAPEVLKSKDMKVDTASLEEYRSRIAKWLGGK